MAEIKLERRPYKEIIDRDDSRQLQKARSSRRENVAQLSESWFSSEIVREFKRSADREKAETRLP